MGIAALFKWGTLSDSFFQLNLVDRQISGATRLLLSLLADDVLFVECRVYILGVVIRCRISP